MLNLYLDAAGHPAYRPKGDTDFYVTAGVLVTDAQRLELEGRLDSLVEKFFPDREPRTVKIHLTRLCAGEDEWALIEGKERGKFLDEMRDVLLTVKPILYAQVMHKARYNDYFHTIIPEPPAENTLRFLLGRVSKYVAAARERCRITLDWDSRETRQSFANLVNNIRLKGDKIAGMTYRPENVTKLDNFFDPLFVEARASRCLQVADYAAYWCWKAAEQKKARRLREIDPLWNVFGWQKHREPRLSMPPEDIPAIFYGPVAGATE